MKCRVAGKQLDEQKTRYVRFYVFWKEDIIVEIRKRLKATEDAKRRAEDEIIRLKEQHLAFQQKSSNDGFMMRRKGNRRTQ